MLDTKQLSSHPKARCYCDCGYQESGELMLVQEKKQSHSIGSTKQKEGQKAVPNRSAGEIENPRVSQAGRQQRKLRCDSIISLCFASLGWPLPGRNVTVLGAVLTGEKRSRVTDSLGGQPGPASTAPSLDVPFCQPPPAKRKCKNGVVLSGLAVWPLVCAITHRLLIAMGWLSLTHANNTLVAVATAKAQR